MKLIRVKLQNFRCYKEEITISFDQHLTALVGRNDVGKSTIMDALDIFFNEGTPDKNDACKFSDDKDIKITCIFCDLPESLTLDESSLTSLRDEFLVNGNEELEIQKIFNGALDKPKLKTLSVLANHPTLEQAKDLIQLNNRDLKQRAIDLAIDTRGIDTRSNAQLRSAIRNSFTELALDLVPVLLFDVNVDVNANKFWKGIQAVLPAFALFKADRESTDQDNEAQDPLKSAIKEALKQKETELNAITEYVQEEIKKIADLTLEKLKEMDPTLASTLSPSIAQPNWSSLFKASITGDNNIPINKRGSGVRRLILLNFFRAKAQKELTEQNRSSVILAIEEPETSQHPKNQRLLLSALSEIATLNQVIITTHTPMLVRGIPDPAIRFINEDNNGKKAISIGGSEETNQLIVSSLGVLPDHTVKVFIGVEGKTDIPFLKNISKMLSESGVEVPNLEQLELDGKLIFIPLGGSGLAHWCNRLHNLNRPEFHVYDRDTTPPAIPKYQSSIDKVNLRTNCFATSTQKREIENYLHVESINEAIAEIGFSIQLPQQPSSFDDVPHLLVNLLNTVAPQSSRWRETRAKELLCNQASSKMTKERLDTVDPDGEVLEWLQKIKEFLEQPL
jgi:putative ATP-dependent endonuclease of OLD family